ADGESDPAVQRRHRALAQVLADLCMERELAQLGDELGTAQATATIEVDGGTMGYYQAAVEVQNEPDRDRRRRIEAARLAETARLNPLRERLLRRHHELIAQLGFDGYVSFYSTLKGIDVAALGALMAGFLTRTRDL